MRNINLVTLGSMALILGAAAFSAGCGDDTDSGTGGGSSTASSTTGEGGGGGGQGGSGQGGSGEGGAGQGGSGGSGAECVRCPDPLLGEADPNDLCESSKAAYDAVRACMCEACGAADGDPCYAACTAGGERTEECTACGSEAALTPGGACKTQGDACIADAAP